jgi:hypothetical protein
MNSYVRNGSEAFNARLDAVLKRLSKDLAAALGDGLEALVLGGGYGRGEGGMVVRNGEEHPYNDLDLLLVVKRHGVPLDAAHPVTERYAKELGIEVDLSRPVTIADIENWPPWLMWHEFVQGHTVLYGPSDILTGHAPKRVLGPPPAIEALRLLLNRGAGLLWARRVAAGIDPPMDPDFVRRNAHKCAMALGDALTVVHRRHVTAYEGRDLRIAALVHELGLSFSFDLPALYAEALRFRFRPDQASDAPWEELRLRTLARQWAEVLLHVEGVRTGMAWESVSAYCAWSGIREQEMNTCRAIVKNGARNLSAGRLSLRHPREALYRRLPALLLAGTDTPGWAEKSGLFLALWRRFN